MHSPPCPSRQKGVVALLAAKIVGPRAGRFSARDQPPNELRGHSSALSALGTFLLTWQPPDKDALPDGSLRVWNVATSTCVSSFHMKQLRREAWPGVQWSADEV